MGKITKDEGIKALKDAKAKLAKASTKDETLAVLLEAGQAVGYSPAMRCLVAGKEPEQSIKWG
ncbi:MAG: hypothetical protein WC196_06245 [Bacilli bacterium]|jgi:hypothetical protein